jgi:hypothetical protein
MKRTDDQPVEAVNRANQPISKEEYEMLAAFRYALRRFMRFSERAAQAAGITPQQHQVLLVKRTGRVVATAPSQHGGVGQPA